MHLLSPQLTLQDTRYGANAWRRVAHYMYPQSNGQAELSRLAEMQTVVHPSANWVWCRETTLGPPCYNYALPPPCTAYGCLLKHLVIDDEYRLQYCTGRGRTHTDQDDGGIESWWPGSIHKEARDVYWMQNSVR